MAIQREETVFETMNSTIFQNIFSASLKLIHAIDEDNAELALKYAQIIKTLSESILNIRG